MAFDSGKLPLLADEAAQKQLSLAELVSHIVPEELSPGDPIGIMLAFAENQQATLGTSIQLRDLL